MAAQSEAQTIDVLGRMLEASSRPQPAPHIQVDVHVPEQQAPVVNVHMPEQVPQEPARVEVTMPDIVVNVPEQPAPQVTVAAAKMPDVHVHVPEPREAVVAAAMPPVTAVRVEVDRKGNKTYIPIRDGE